MGKAPGGQPLALAVLGPLHITCSGEPVRFAYDKVRALLVYLAVEAERPIPATSWPSCSGRVAPPPPRATA